MSRIVVINLGLGDLQNGCPEVTAKISPAVGDFPSPKPQKSLRGTGTATLNRIASSNRHPIQVRGSLPPKPEIEQLYRNWQLLYREFYQERISRSVPTQEQSSLSTRAIQIDPGGVTHFCEVEFRDLGKQLKDQVNAWLNSESFHPIDRRLSRVLDPADEIRVIFETNDDLLRRLPWHLWNFFEDYPKAEIALSNLEYGRVEPEFKTPPSKVRILAILGNSEGIDLQVDRKLIEALPGAAPLFLESPRRQELDEQLWNRKGWDIMFFGGHSQTEEESGRIHLNQTDSLTLDQLRNALKRAISRGLKLAIFNSCDGLGLARDLADLHIPQTIVMRESVPDAIAQEFFQYFLEAFSGGQSLYASVREARERLEKLEDDYPYATWLPVICQNPATGPTTWQELCAPDKPSLVTNKHRLLTVLLASVVATALILGIRQLGVLQQWELQAFDQLMRLRPGEEPDPRLLIVTVTEKDVQNQDSQKRRGSSLSDRALTDVLEKLQPYQPSAIGLDIYRDFPVDPNYEELKNSLQRNKNFIAVCKVGGIDDNSVIGSPPEVPDERLSFSDFPVDPDGVIRRQLLGMAEDSDSVCATDVSFSFRVAGAYLAAQGIHLKSTPEEDLQIGNAVFKKLASHVGGYHQIDAGGYQVLLNYRSSEPVAEQITLTELLRETTDDELADLVKDRIVLIGTTAPSFKDYSLTPYSVGRGPQGMSGVVIHAHMLSQILSAVLDQRPLLWWLPQWGETLWVWGWSLVGGVLVLYFRSPLRLGLASGAALGTLYGLCFVLLLKGGWVPLVPSALVLLATGGSVVAYTVSQTRQQ